jgi:hypothetical protein
MANKRVIPIDAGAQKPNTRRVVVQARNGNSGIEIQVQLAPDASALPSVASIAGAESSEVAGAISFRGCDDIHSNGSTSSLTNDDPVGVLADGEAKPRGAASTFSTLEGLSTATRDWRMSQFVSLWNELPGVQALTRFENRKVAIERLWRQIEKLRNQTRPRPTGEAEKKAKVTAASKSESMLALLQAPEGATLSALMAASGWQAHSVRGFVSGTVSKRLGLKVDSFRSNGERVYALRAAPASDHAASIATAGVEASNQEGA